MQTLTNKKILITGASGFIGSFVVERALALGLEVWAAIRPHSSRAYLTDPRIHFIQLDLSDVEILRTQLRDHAVQHGAWDYVVHAAGATKVQHTDDFYQVNFLGTKHLCDTLHDEQMLPERFIFVSSLSVFGPIREERLHSGYTWKYRPILDTDTPCPNTHYGHSKLAAEEYLHHFADFPYVILRPTGVYGPREKDYFLMAKSISQHIDFAAGFAPQELTFVYVEDLVTAIFLAIERAPLQSAYFITDGHVYDSSTYSKLLQQALGVKRVLRLCTPLWLLRTICIAAQCWSRCTGQPTTLNTDKYHIMSQRNWQCDIAAARAELGYTPAYPLARGVKETVSWYKQMQWL